MTRKLRDDELMQDDVDDAVMQQDFEDGGAVYPKVDASTISTMMREVAFHTYRVPDTTTIIAVAVLELNGRTFTLAQGETACADPRNFNEEKGKTYAIQKASKAARDKLWELEGYLLFKEIAQST